MGNIPLKFLPSQLSGLKLWTRFNSGITVTGSGVSQWNDQSGDGNHLLQATDADRPSKESDGSILFDGVSDALKAVSFTLVQPETIYLLARQVSYNLGARIFDANIANRGTLLNEGASPQIKIFAGLATVAARSDWAVGAYQPVASIFNGASSSLKVGSNAETTGNPGAQNMDGFNLGGGSNSLNFSNIQVKEVIVYNTAHNAAQRSQIINYLAQVGELSI